MEFEKTTTVTKTFVDDKLRFEDKVISYLLSNPPFKIQIIKHTLLLSYYGTQIVMPTSFCPELIEMLIASHNKALATGLEDHPPES